MTGAVTFSVIIGDHDYVCNASIVPDLAYKIVLGRDFLHKSSAVINIRQQLVTFSENNAVCFANDDLPPLVSEVRVSNTQVIDAHSEAIIPAYLTSFPATPVIGLLEATPKLSNEYHLLVAISVSSSNTDGKVSFR